MNLFKPFSCGTLKLDNRIVMAPMTRRKSPGGVPTDEVAAYYERRAAADVGLIVTEGTWINSKSASNSADVPRFYGADALAGWKTIVDRVHRAGGKIVPQLWHVGAQAIDTTNDRAPDEIESPSGFYEPEAPAGIKLSQSGIEDLISAYADGVEIAQRLGFDGVEFHAAHGYLIDQFFWHQTNRRTDKYGGALLDRARFGIEMLEECRRRVGPDFPLIMRISQFKAGHYDEKLASTPSELAPFVEALYDAGVTIFHCSQRRFWQAEYESSDLNLAGWVKKITGAPTIAVGSVGLSQDGIISNYLKPGSVSEPASLGRLEFMLDRGDFDLIAVGRALLQDPYWVTKIREKRFDELEPYSIESVSHYY